MTVTTHTDAGAVWRQLVQGFIGDAAACNWVLSSVERSARLHPDDGFRCWLVTQHQAVSGIGLYLPSSGRVALTPISQPAARIVAKDAFEQIGVLSGVFGAAGSSASFAGQWSDLTRTGARPVEGQRVLEAPQVSSPDVRRPGGARPATADDLDVLVNWNAGFSADTGVEPPTDPEKHLERHVDAGAGWVWQGPDGAEAMALLTEPVFGTRRIAHVYTPDQLRGLGTATALVAELTDRTLRSGHRCMLHTQLSNPRSNAIYQRLGFFVVSESVIYEFDT